MSAAIAVWAVMTVALLVVGGLNLYDARDAHNKAAEPAIRLVTGMWLRRARLHLLAAIQMLVLLVLVALDVLPPGWGAWQLVGIVFTFGANIWLDRHDQRARINEEIGQ